MLRVAVAKGKGLDEIFQIFRKAKIKAEPEGRELEVRTPDAVFWYIKPFDVPVWVEEGVADIGFVGMDVIKEVGADIFTFFDTGAGRCRISLAGPEGSQKLLESPRGKVKVATKYPSLAKKYLVQIFPNFEIIRLSGSVELAPASGLADLILDLVSTGRTLRENNLTELVSFEKFSIWVVGNKNSYILKFPEVSEFLLKVARAVGKESVAKLIEEGRRYFGI